MTDEIDMANDYAQKLEAEETQTIRNAAANIPKGSPGECWSCGEHSERLVKGACAPCRDEYGLE